MRVEPCIVAGVPPQAKLPVTFPNIENEEGNRKKTWPRLHRDRSSPLPHLHLDWAHPCPVYAGTGLAPAALDCAQP